MLDRLISGAGAITDLFDRGVRAIARSAGSRVADTRPGSALVAVALALLALGLGVVGFESGSTGGPRTLGAADVAAGDGLGERAYATVTGHQSRATVQFSRPGTGRAVASPHSRFSLQRLQLSAPRQRSWPAEKSGAVR